MAPEQRAGIVRWSWPKGSWYLGMAVGSVVALAVATPGAVLMSGLLTAFCLCCGHSAGVHRGLIHRSYLAPLWLDRTLAYFGMLVGIAGPIGLIKQHNTRDHFQNSTDCDRYYSHLDPFLLDWWTQNCCVFDRFDGFEPQIRPEVAADPFIQFLERTWRWQQVPVALVLFAIGGWPWVFWGICVRVFVGVTGHWAVGWVAHRLGERPRIVADAMVQGTNSWLGIISFGEGWHNNHHAWPESARIGHEPGQVDLGWMFLSFLQALGIISQVKLPGYGAPAKPLVAAMPESASYPS